MSLAPSDAENCLKRAYQKSLENKNLELQGRFRIKVGKENLSGFAYLKTNTFNQTLIELRHLGFTAAFIWMDESKAQIYIPNEKRMFVGSPQDPLPLDDLNVSIEDFIHLIWGESVDTQNVSIEKQIKNRLPLKASTQSADFTGDVDAELCKVVSMQNWPKKGNALKFEYPSRWKHDFPKSFKLSNEKNALDWSILSLNKDTDNQLLELKVPYDTFVSEIKELKKLL